MKLKLELRFGDVFRLNEQGIRELLQKYKEGSIDEEAAVSTLKKLPSLPPSLAMYPTPTKRLQAHRGFVSTTHHLRQPCFVVKEFLRRYSQAMFLQIMFTMLGI